MKLRMSLTAAAAVLTLASPLAAQQAGSAPGKSLPGLVKEATPSAPMTDKSSSPASVPAPRQDASVTRPETQMQVDPSRRPGTVGSTFAGDEERCASAPGARPRRKKSTRRFNRRRMVAAISRRRMPITDQWPPPTPVQEFIPGYVIERFLSGREDFDEDGLADDEYRFSSGPGFSSGEHFRRRAAHKRRAVRKKPRPIVQGLATARTRDCDESAGRPAR